MTTLADELLVRDDGADFVRVRDRVAELAQELPLDLVLCALRKRNAKGATVDCLADVAKRHGVVENGTMVWPSTIAALNAYEGSGAIVVGRTDDGGVRVLKPSAHRNMQVREETWRTFALACERDAARRGGEGMGYGGAF